MITYHPVGSNVRLRFLLIDGLGDGLNGQVPVVSVKRRSDGEFWTGSAWQAGFVTLSMTLEDGTNLPGSYFVDFDQASAGGTQEEYLMSYRNVAAPPNNFTDEEQHVFRTFSSIVGSPERRLGASVSDDGVKIRVSLWIEEGGQRANDFTLMAAQIKDGQGNSILNFGTNGAPDSDGVFYFEQPVDAVARNQPYLITVQATRGITTDNYNLGLVRV